MDGIHDLGGLEGFGRIPFEDDGSDFAGEWQAHVFALGGLVLGAGIGNVDKFRHAVERVPPVEYLTAGYYARWLRALEILVEEAGVRGDFTPEPFSPSAERPGDHPPRFGVGDRVRTEAYSKPGHTRLPRYARDRIGVVVEVHPVYVLPDSNAHDLGENPQHVYSVQFHGHDLWGPESDPQVVVSLDLFESYLSAAGGTGEGNS